MGHASFFTPEARDKVRDAVAAIERGSSAEIVVAVRHSSGHYRHTDLAVGGAAALAGLCVFLYAPEPFEFTYLPLELLGIFGAAAVMTAYAPPVRRLLSSRALMDRSVREAARAMFVDRGIMKTQGRTGMLVYASMLERRVELVADVGIDEQALGSRWREARSRLERVIEAGGELDAFVSALSALGPILAEGLPRAADDVNELPDEVVS